MCQIVQGARRKTLQTTACSAARPPNPLGLAMRPRNVHNGPGRFVPNESKSGSSTTMTDSVFAGFVVALCRKSVR